ncbi:MAG: RiPP maturation radical SAM C-methyltransferase [Bradymonadales bacterium]|nr:RiPP maturation radical SAM C-methyltransferase [Bradymonadales bacterium]
MRIALIAMPWANFDLPSPALGILAAVVRRDRPEWKVDCLYEYVEIWSHLGVLYEEIAREDRLGEWIYAAHLFPEREGSVRERFIAWASERTSEPPDGGWLSSWERVRVVTGDRIEELARRVAGPYDLVGFTTSYCQLFPSLAVARRIKQIEPGTRIVLGGAAVTGRCGESLLATFDHIDHVIQGEGERRLLGLLDALETGSSPGLRMDGVLSRIGRLPPVGRQAVEGTGEVESRDGGIHLPEEAPGVANRAPIEAKSGLGSPAEPALRLTPGGQQVEDLDSLPLPDHDGYAELARRYGIVWRLPIEGSRGCWWDRRRQETDRPKGCFFCSLSSGSYRVRARAQVVEEMKRQGDRYQNLRFRFLDNLLPPKGLIELADTIRGLGRDLNLFCEARASIRPIDLLRLKRAGLDTVQIGIEGLSGSYLKRIGKGTTVIQNLLAMKSCYELGIYCGANLLVGFPGATRQEVDETAETIRRYAICYQPLSIVRFQLCPGSTVYLCPERFGVTAIRNAEDFLAGLPRPIWERLQLSWLDYTETGEQADWSEVRHCVGEWWDLHHRLTLQDGAEWFLGDRPLAYSDGGSFLEIMDRRRDLDLVVLEEPWRDLYLYCCDIRSRREIGRRLSDLVARETLDRALGGLVEARLMYREGERYLSLAVASRPEAAARRIEGMSADGEEGSASSEPVGRSGR